MWHFLWMSWLSRFLEQCDHHLTWLWVQCDLHVTGLWVQCDRYLTLQLSQLDLLLLEPFPPWWMAFSNHEPRQTTLSWNYFLSGLYHSNKKSSACAETSHYMWASPEGMDSFSHTVFVKPGTTDAFCLPIHKDLLRLFKKKKKKRWGYLKASSWV